MIRTRPKSRIPRQGRRRCTDDDRNRKCPFERKGAPAPTRPPDLLKPATDTPDTCGGSARGPERPRPPPPPRPPTRVPAENRTVHLAGWHECERRTSGSLRSIWSDGGGRRSIAPLPARVSFVLVAIADEAYSWLTSQSDWFARSVAVVHVAADGCGQRMIHRIHPRLGDVCIIARCCKRCVANFRRQVTLRCNAFGVAHRRL